MYGRVPTFVHRVIPLEPRHVPGVLKLAYVLAIVAAADVSIDGTFGTYLPLVDGWVVFDGLAVEVPAFVYLYAFAGAGAYVLTSLIFEPKESTTEVLRLGYRLVASLPLGAGVFLLAALVLGLGSVTGNGSENGTMAVSDTQLLAGLAFLAGLFVRLTLRKLGDVAEQLYDINAEPELPYEELRRRNEASANLRRAYSRLLDGDGSLEAVRLDELRGRLRQVEAILGDEDATLQEVDRALTLSEEVLQAFSGPDDRDEQDGRVITP